MDTKAVLGDDPPMVVVIESPTLLGNLNDCH
jgi:hypothetical protein